MNYSKADSLLEGRCKLSRKMGNNTHLVRHSGVPGDSIHLKLHDTYIVTWYADGRTELNSGGWRTVTTKARMNEHLENGFGISQLKGQWYLTRYHAGKSEDVCMFEDGLIIASDGTVTGGLPIEDAKKLLSLRRKVNRFATAYAQAFSKGEVPAPTVGEGAIVTSKPREGDAMTIEQLWDVVEVSMAGGEVVAFMGEGKTARNAGAIEKMAIMRRGVEHSFYASVPAGSHKVGQTFDQNAS